MTKTTAADVYEITTARIVAAIEAGAGTWTMPWNTTRGGFPFNPTTKVRYRGGNVLVLMAAAIGREYPTAAWATYKQWVAVDAQVRLGEKGTTAIYWGRRKPKPGEEEAGDRGRLFPSVFSLFNAAQVDGWESPADTRDTPAAIEEAEKFFAAIPAKVIHSLEGRAYYAPAADHIMLPPLETFDTAPAYYATRAHESAHWTAPKGRCDRDLSGRFGDNAYAAEELVAELSAAFTCATIGISTTPRPDHAAYLAHWLRVLKADPKALFTAASKAQAATDYLVKFTAPAGAPAEEEMAAV